MTARPDYYAEAQGIAVSLFERGEFDWSSKIEDAIAGGATGTEILMRMRSTMRELVESGAATTEEEGRIRTLIGELDSVLR
jgi:hypothetical protein